MTERSSQLTTLCILTLIASILHILAEGAASVFFLHYFLAKGWMVFFGLGLSVIGCLLCFMGALRMFKRKNKGFTGYVFGKALHLIGLLVVWLLLTPFDADYGKGGQPLIINSSVILIEFLFTIFWVYGYNKVSHEWEINHESEPIDPIIQVELQADSMESL